MTGTRAIMVVPKTIEQVLLLMSDPAVRTQPMGGGTHVMSQLNHDFPRISRIVDLAHLAHFAQVRVEAGSTRLGPSVTYATLVDPRQHGVPRLLRQIAGGITGGPQIRSQGTIGGSACYANPASDIPAGLVALRAQMVVVSSSSGTRTVLAEDFFVSAFETVLRKDEILVDIVIPHDAETTRWGYVKLKTTESSWPVAVAAAEIVETQQPGLATITIGGAAEVPFVVPSLQLQMTSELAEDDRQRIRSAVRSSPVTWWADELTDASYRSRIAEIVAVRAVEDALKKAIPNE